jgi:hypothetical protein
MIRYIFILLLLVVCATPFNVFAQTPSADLSISMIPGNPKPLTPVQLEAKSYGLDLNQATIEWRYENKVIDRGVGRTRISVTAPATGLVATVSVTVSGIGFEPTSTSVVLRPGSIDLLWEAVDSYTPPFYKGKALPATNATLRIMAVPAVAAPKQISYQWSRANAVVEQSSGYGKSSMVFKNSEFNTQEHISVLAEGGQFSGTNSITINPVNPSLFVYQKKEGFIDYASGSGSLVSTNTSGVALRFEPFFFSRPRSSMSDLTFDFSINGNAVTGDPVPNELRLSRPDGGGVSTIKVSVQPVEYLVQHLERAITLAFN